MEFIVRSGSSVNSRRDGQLGEYLYRMSVRISIRILCLLQSGFFSGISNPEIERMKYNLALNMKRGKPLLFCGIAGTGKSTIVRDFLSELHQRVSVQLLLDLSWGVLV